MGAVERAISSLHAVRIAELPVGKSLGFILAISVTQILNGLLARILPKAMEWPIVPAFGIAYLQTIPAVKRIVGTAGAEMIAIAALYAGIDMQVARVTGTSLSQTVANLVTRPFRVLAPVTAPVERPASAPIGQPGEVGAGTWAGMTDLESGMRLNMLS